MRLAQLGPKEAQPGKSGFLEVEDGLRHRFPVDLESNRAYLDILNDYLRAFLRVEGLTPHWADKRADFLTKYLADYWYGTWWPQHQPVIPLVRVGLIKAIHVANMVP